MLVRLEGAMDRNDLIEQMVLLPEPLQQLPSGLTLQNQST
jgi:hypothetical protein